MHQKHTPIMLRRDGDDVIVEMDFGVKNKDGNSWVEVIRVAHDSPFSHIVEDGGIERAKLSHYDCT